MSTTKNDKKIINEPASSKSMSEADMAKPTWKDIEKALREIVKAGVDYKMEKDGTFMKNWRKKFRKLSKEEDPDKFIVDNAKQLFPNETQYRRKISDTKEWYQYKPRVYKALLAYYKMNYTIAKEYFKSEEELEKETDEFLNEETDEEDVDLF